MMRRGIIDNCTICGERDRLIRQCTRCHKYACQIPDCIKFITTEKLCSVPARFLVLDARFSDIGG
jgi:hypothetical protein